VEADEVRRTLEGAGFQVLTQGDRGIMRQAVLMTLSVPQADANDAREFLRQDRARQHDLSGEAPADAVNNAAQEVVELRKDHTPKACKYCNIATLDVSEADLASHQIALLRAVGLGVNAASFSDFEPGERICTECANRDVQCEICERELDALLDQGIYRRAIDDEAYICARCVEALDTAIDSQRDW
jgi:pyruvate formate-lyase activating enzyme-like uncharacterized protein